MKKIKDIKINGANLHFSFCHQKPERSFFWKGKQLPLCARCTGINLGYFVLPLFIFGVIRIPLLWTLLMIVPTYIDGTIQAYFNIESNNTRRFVTGLKVLSFCIPLAGAIIYFTSKKDSPNKAKSACHAALWGVGVGIVLQIIATVAGVGAGIAG